MRMPCGHPLSLLLALVALGPIMGCGGEAPVSSSETQSLHQRSTASLDDHGDTPDTATPVTPGLRFAGFLTDSWDRDVFSFTAAPGHFYRFGCTFQDATSLWKHEWIQEQGIILAYEMVYGPDAPGLHFKPGAGTKFLRLETDSLELSGEYTCLLDDLGPDDHGDDVANATPLTWPIRLSAALETAFDTDAFSVNLLAGQTRIVRAGGNFSTRVRVLGPDGAEVPRSYQGEFTPTLPGVHHILVQPEVTPWSFPSGPYQLLLE